MIFDLDVVDDPPLEHAELLKAVTYIRANACSITNYGKRYRAGEVTSSAFAEPAVNQVISKRMVNKQQMRWTPRSAHLLLQVRTRVLNDDLATTSAAGIPASPTPIPSGRNWPRLRSLPRFVPASLTVTGPRFQSANTP